MNQELIIELREIVDTTDNFRVRETCREAAYRLEKVPGWSDETPNKPDLYTAFWPAIPMGEFVDVVFSAYAGALVDKQRGVRITHARFKDARWFGPIPELPLPEVPK
jgi:hypothetical protein